MAIFNKENLQKIQSEAFSEKKTYTILIVDDEEANLRLLQNLLYKEYKILTANDGKEALELVQNHEHPESIQLIITDQRMPRMTGIDFLEQVLSIIPKTIRMILTGFTDIEAIIDAINKGYVYKFIIKPFDRNDMLQTVRLALEAFELEDRNLKLLDELQDLNIGLEEKVRQRTQALQETFKVQERLSAQLAKKNKEMDDDLIKAEAVQRTFFSKAPEPAFLRICSQLLPHSHVSGDMMSFYTSHDDQFNIFLGNSSGHGMTAALSTIMADTMFKHFENEPPQKIMIKLNQFLEANLPPDRFMSGLHLQISESGDLTALFAGHPPFILLTQNEPEPILLEGDSFSLGMFSNEVFELTETHYQLKPGDIGLLYTDGVTEKMNLKEEFFGLKRLCDFMKEHGSIDIEVLVTLLMESVDHFAEGQPRDDDITIIAFQYTPCTL